ncbi:tRNA epoxyqueuosine(34) reductase QueG [Acidobacteria bacterium AB60]|nr:tRNA epoxyqueuosine(34) reductase QueG [Acidobacteria bacterium AB60]
MQIERDVLLAHQGLQLRDQAVIIAPHQLGQALGRFNLVGTSCTTNADHDNLRFYGYSAAVHASVAAYTRPCPRILHASRQRPSSEYAETTGHCACGNSPWVSDCALAVRNRTCRYQLRANTSVGSVPPAFHNPGNRSGAVLLTREQSRALALEAGFREAGLVALPHSNNERDARRFTDWIRQGRSGTMNYLSRTNEEQQLVRAQANIPFPWARSAIVCLASYHSAQPRSTDPAPPHAGWIARYAWSSRVLGDGKRIPSDYHKVLLKRLKSLESRLQEECGLFESRAYVDTGPVVERALATAAGLGWTGKNTCLIHPGLGSYVFLAVLLTSLQAAPGQASLTIPDRCGTCRRCLDACPTNALDAPYQMDATRCISYLTIEHRDAIDPGLMEGMGRQVFGCDICQDVCPWNRKAPIGADPELEPRPELVNPALEALAAMDEPAFERAFNGSPVRRAGFGGLRRNLAIAMGNSGERRFTACLRAWAAAADSGLRAAASWALEKLEGRPS